MGIKLFDSELKVMEVLWREGDTVIKKCVEKGAVKRGDPSFMCSALLTRTQVQNYETEELIGKMFDGSKEKFFAAFLDGEKLSKEEIESLKRLVMELE